MELSTIKQVLIALASNAAKGNQDKLKEVLHFGFDNQLTVAKAKEALAQLYAYIGFPRSLNAQGTLQAAIAEREKAGKRTEKGQDGEVLPTGFDALKEGTAVQTQLGGGKPFNYQFSDREDYFLKAHLFGDIFSNKVLSFDERELVTIGAIAALEGCDPQLFAHCTGSLNMGVKEGELREVPDVLAKYAGEKEAWRARKAIAKVFEEPFEEGEPVDFNIWPKGDPNAAYAQFFVGNSHLAAMGSLGHGPHNVTFEPGCRNNWHIHHKCEQVLVCVAGRGWYQEWGKEPVALRPGMVIDIPKEVKHWHGAAKDSWFQHLAYMTDVEEDASNEWLEAVSDEEYNQLEIEN